MQHATASKNQQPASFTFASSLKKANVQCQFENQLTHTNISL
jgi:hypothetical protein